MTVSSFNSENFNKEKFEELWDHLNANLIKIEKEKDLTAALETLERQQFDQGFIQDDLKDVERYRLIDDDDETLAFTAQFNPRRADRHGGAGRKIPPPGVIPVNGGCFLCRENVRWQQRGIEIGYDLLINDNHYVAWMNPFPLMPTHTTLARKDHIPQSWIDNSGADSKAKIRSVLTDFLDLASRLPQYIGFYNGEGAGASIPGHFHFQFFRRPEGQEFPLERVAAVAMAEHHHHSPLILRKYPIKAIYFFGSKNEIVDQAGRWAQQWTDFYESDLALSANIIASLDTKSDSKNFHLFFVPRNRFYSHAPGLTGLVGGLEVLGEMVFCTDKEKQRLVAGKVDYSSIVRILSAVEAPGVLEFLDTIPQ